MHTQRRMRRSIRGGPVAGSQPDVADAILAKYQPG